DPDRSLPVFRKGRGDCERMFREMAERLRPPVPAAQSIDAVRSDASDPNAAPAIFKDAKNIVGAKAVASRVDGFGRCAIERANRNGGKTHESFARGNPPFALLVLQDGLMPSPRRGVSFWNWRRDFQERFSAKDV